MRRAPALLALALAVAPSPGRAGEPPAFTAIVLGASGGIDEADLTSILLAPAGTEDFVALDAGTLYAGIERAVRRGSIAPPRPAIDVVRRSVRAYLISHPHLDHVAGLAIVAPDEAAAKPILGLAPTIDALRKNLFQPPLWANFTDEGESRIGRYHLTAIEEGAPAPVAGTKLSVQAWPLSHGGMTSTAFLVKLGDAYALYLGDTGPDEVEKKGTLKALWQRVAAHVKSGALRAIFIECSYPDPRANDQLFGHMTPRWIVREMDALAALVDGKDAAGALRSVTLIITHIKPAMIDGVSARARITEQLQPLAPRLRRLIVPTSGDRIDF